ncbi:hypothetical protein ONE63_008492 [Megalurothrips usitatus]|uniref:Uncharacterized protein n=1 Tax=Megalurothrips usitatus TaxID=439358 RepID=A0AAV7XQG9_9NEOP|nr:hypothetical protein ONE63_008492 [Megalurothrips usitatus]
MSASGSSGSSGSSSSARLALLARWLCLIVSLLTWTSTESGHIGSVGEPPWEDTVVQLAGLVLGAGAGAGRRHLLLKHSELLAVRLFWCWASWGWGSGPGA